MSLTHPVVPLGATPPTSLPDAFAAINDAFQTLDAGARVETVDAGAVPSNTVLSVFPDVIVVTGANAAPSGSPYVVRVPGGAARPAVLRPLIVKNLTAGWVRIAEDGWDLVSIDQSGANISPGRTTSRLSSGRGSFLAPSLHQASWIAPVPGFAVPNVLGGATPIRVPVRNRFFNNEAGLIASAAHDTWTVSDVAGRVRVSIEAAFAGIEPGLSASVDVVRWAEEAGTTPRGPFTSLQVTETGLLRATPGRFLTNPVRNTGMQAGRWLSIELGAQNDGVVCVSLNLNVEIAL